MADARKTWAQLDVLFATNAAGAISAQDLRDGFQSLQPHEAAAAPTVNDDETAGFDVGHKWVDTSEPAIYECRDGSTGAAVWTKLWPVTASVAWGDITGTLGDQTDLGSALDGKAAAVHTHTLSDITDAGTAAAADTGDFATAAQGALADTAVQPGDLAAVATSGAADDVSYDNTMSGLTATDVQAAIDEVAASSGGTPDWGDIGGTLSSQTDLQAALDAKLAKLATINSFAGNHTLDSSDSGAYVRISAAGTVTLPDGLATGFQCVIVNATDAATVALSAATTLTIPSGFNAEVVNRRAVTVIHVGSNVWEAHGALVETL